MQQDYLTIVLAPLLAAIAAGVFGKRIGRTAAHWSTILAVGVSFGLSLYTLIGLIQGTIEPSNESVYRWATVGGMHMEVGFLVDKLTATMMGASILMSWNCTFIGESSAVRARMTPMLKIFDPTTFPTARSPRPASAAFTLTITSGILVPIATTVRPTTKGVRPKRSASDELPLTKPSAPKYRRTSDAIIHSQ